jgi:hypothetical protein
MAPEVLDSGVIVVKQGSSRLGVMYYYKAACVIGDGVRLVDYVEADSDGVLQRIVSFDGERWWASSREYTDGDDGHRADLDLADAITGAEFERVWRMAVALRAPDPV